MTHIIIFLNTPICVSIHDMTNSITQVQSKHERIFKLHSFTLDHTFVVVVVIIIII
jgi:hypothetical protein